MLINLVLLAVVGCLLIAMSFLDDARRRAKRRAVLKEVEISRLMDQLVQQEAEKELLVTRAERELQANIQWFASSMPKFPVAEAPQLNAPTTESKINLASMGIKPRVPEYQMPDWQKILGQGLQEAATVVQDLSDTQRLPVLPKHLVELPVTGDTKKIDVVAVRRACKEMSLRKLAGMLPGKEANLPELRKQFLGCSVDGVQAMTALIAHTLGIPTATRNLQKSAG